MFYIFTYIIFGLCTGFLYFLNELISNHFSSWEPHFLSSRILQLVRLEFPFSPAFLHASDDDSRCGPCGGFVRAFFTRQRHA